MKTNTVVKYKTQIREVGTDRLVKDNPWKKNLVLDQGLNALAQSTFATQPAGSFTRCHVGSGTNPNRFQGGVITFTQTGTTITASAPFFTSGMVNGIFKYGTNTAGAEYYITAFGNSTTITVDTSATVAVPTAGTVWMVQQTALQTQSFTTNTYQTLSGDCGSTYSAPTLTHKRTFVFAVQASPYTVNEIGWSNGQSTAVFGRAVLSSSDVVGTTNYYVVIMEIDFVYQPFNPTAVVDVGTGINTAGTAMMEFFANGIVNSSGAQTQPANGMSNVLDGTSGVFGFLFLQTFTQNATIQTTGTNPARPASNRLDLTGVGVAWTYVSGSKGKMRLTFTLSTTTTGQTCYGLAIQSGASPFSGAFTVLFTTPQTLPTGAFVPTIIWEMTYGRVLDNA